MHSEGIEGASSDMSSADRGGLATGETMVHIESPIYNSNGDDLIFGGDDTIIDGAGD